MAAAQALNSMPAQYPYNRRQLSPWYHKLHMHSPNQVNQTEGKLTSRRTAETLQGSPGEHGRLRKSQWSQVEQQHSAGTSAVLHSTLDRAVKERPDPARHWTASFPRSERQRQKILHPRSGLSGSSRQKRRPAHVLPGTGGGIMRLTALLWSVGLRQRTISKCREASRPVRDRASKCHHQPAQDRKLNCREFPIPQSAVELLQQETWKHRTIPWIFPLTPRQERCITRTPSIKLHEKILGPGAGTSGFDLQRTFATIALQNGVDVKTVSAVLTAITRPAILRTYTTLPTDAGPGSGRWAALWNRWCLGKAKEITEIGLWEGFPDRFRLFPLVESRV